MVRGTGKRNPHIRPRKETDGMDEFIRSMSIILIRALAQAERIEDCLNKKKYELAHDEVADQIVQLGQLVKAFGDEIKT